jgi:hypothetical protein
LEPKKNEKNPCESIWAMMPLGFLCILAGKLSTRQGTLDPPKYPSQKRGGDWMNFTPIYFIVIRTLPSLH